MRLKSGNRIRICHVAMGDLWAGAEVQLAVLASELVHRPDLDLSIVLFNEGRLAEELRALRIPVTVFPENTWTTGRLVHELTAYCRAHRFDILHTHKYKDTLVGALVAARCHIPHLVRTIHGLPEPFRGLEAAKMCLYETIDWAAIRFKVERVIAVSKQIAAVLADRHGRDKVVQIYNGVRLPQIQTRKSVDEVRAFLRVPAGAPLVGIVGRLTPVKGHEYFLLAAQRVAALVPDVRFVLVGDGPLRAPLRKRAAALGLDACVLFVGHRDDTYDFVRALNVFMLPSLHEGIPMVLLEAMALSRPIVASRVGGIPEVIVDGEQGLLVPPADQRGLADACLRFLREGGLADRCGRAALDRVERNFSSEKMGEEFWQLYRALVCEQMQ